MDTQRKGNSGPESGAFSHQILCCCLSEVCCCTVPWLPGRNAVPSVLLLDSSKENTDHLFEVHWVILKRMNSSTRYGQTPENEAMLAGPIILVESDNRHNEHFWIKEGGLHRVNCWAFSENSWIQKIGAQGKSHFIHNSHTVICDGPGTAPQIFSA